MPTCSPKIYSELSRSSGGCCPTGKKYLRLRRLNQDQIYEGEFLRGSLHGEGTYKWRDLGVYEGGFYSNHKEGYALMSYPDNSCFEGLFVRNQRFGPGIYTHPNGRQDAGFWMGRKLVRLSRAVDFIVPRLAPTTAAKIKLLQFRRLIPIDEEVFDPMSEIYSMCGCPLNCLSCPYSNLIFDPRSFFFDKMTFERIYFLNTTHASEEALDGSVVWGSIDQGNSIDEEVEGEGMSDDISIPSHCLCADKEFVMEYEQSTLDDICEKEFSAGEVEMGILAYFTHHGTIVGWNTKEEEKDDEVMEEAGEMGEEEEDFKEPRLLEWNRSEVCSRMLQQIFRYRDFEGRLTFNIAKLMLGARTEFRRTGEKEMQCVEFLKTCATGPPQVVKTMLCDYDVSEELTDARGNNSVMFAAATDQHEIIDILANYGADLNSFNDESLTPLNLCLLRRLAQVYDLGNWEIAFLVQEIDKTGEQYKVKEWRSRMSIQSLDRIFGDGKSAYDLDNGQSANRCQDKDSNGTKSRSPLISNVSSGMALPSMSKSLLDTTKVSISEKSPFFSCSDSQTISRTKSNSRIIKTEEFEKSVTPSNKDSYFFELAPEKQRKMTSTRKESSRVLRKQSKEEEEEERGEEMLGEQSFLISGMRKKMLDIDKTIEKLLSLGADPNISEVPKPSIHLGVYSRDSKIVNLLLSYGANPNSQLYPNEGLLTPLHVLVLLKSALENVDICDLLLNFGADPEKETVPDFAFSEEEKPFLDLTEGRTPLQLLSMRPDLEYSDPENHLIKIALKLAEASDKTRLYKGYSYLALAMSFKNLKLLKAFLDSKYFEPNAVLGNDMGTVLHLLVSTEFQKKTAYDTSIQICDYLLEAGANPLKRFTHPEKLVGNCIDYGYREIDAEKASRKLLTAEKKENGKKSSKKAEAPEKPSEKDHLTDHVRVMEYLCKRVEEMKKKKKGSKDKKQSRGNVAERKKSSKIIENEKPNEVNEIEAKVEEKVEEKKVENKEEKNNKDEGLAKEESELWKDDDEDSDDDEMKEEGEEKEKKKKRRESDGNKKKKKSVKRKEKGEKPSLKEIKKKTDSSVSKLKLKNSVSKSVGRKQPCLSETFPEGLRQSVLKIFGNCADLDINELLLPYVVLRDGDLYYSANKKGSRDKEQYSLV